MAAGPPTVISQRYCSFVNLLPSQSVILVTGVIVNKCSAIAEIAAQCYIIRISAVDCGLPLFNVHFLSNIWECLHKSLYCRKVVFRATFCRRLYGWITQNNGHYAVQGHSRSPISVPMERSYATSHASAPIWHRGRLLVQFSPSTRGACFNALVGFNP